MANIAACNLNGREEVQLCRMMPEFDFGLLPETINLVAERNTSRVPISTIPMQTAAHELEARLFDLTEAGAGVKRMPVSVEIGNQENFFNTGVIQAGGKTYKVPCDDLMCDALAMGLSVVTYAKPSHCEGAVRLKLSLPFQTIKLTENNLAQILAGSVIDSNVGSVRPVLTSGAVRALLAGDVVLTHTVNAKGQKIPIALYPPSSRQIPMANRFEVFDLPSFIANPAVLAKNAARLPVDLNIDNVNQLITLGSTRIQAGTQRVEIAILNDFKSPQFEKFWRIVGDLQNVGGGLPPLKPPNVSWVKILSLAKKLKKNPHFVHPWRPDPCRFRRFPKL